MVKKKKKKKKKMALIFYYKDMLEKVTMQRTQQFSGFVCYRKNPVKCNACAFARKIETDCFSRNMPISKGRFTRHDFVAYDNFTKGLRHELFRVNQTYISLTATVVCVKNIVVGF